MAKGIKIIGVEADSLASEIDLEIGDRVWTINGKRVRDALDFKFLTSGEEEVTIEVIKADGEEWEIEVDKDESERWGIDFEPMSPRQCGNDCIFCFIQQNPEGSRESLWVRDEDVRFSFMYGNYSTLTTIGKNEVARVIEQKLSPQYVSVHATDLDLRAYLLGYEKRVDVLAQIKHFTENGIEVHAQVVLCPTLNDGQQLIKTIRDLAGLHPGLVSTAIVPLGITDGHKYRDRLIPVTDEYCGEIIDLVSPVQAELKTTLGTAFAFLGDEFYIRAGRKIPDKKHYRIVRAFEAEDSSYPQIEDGVGMVRQFYEEHQRRLRQLAKLREKGEFTEKNAKAIYGTIATGEIFFPILNEAVREMNQKFGTRLKAVEVENTFFGKGVTVAGLLTGRDFVKAAKSFEGKFVMIPKDCWRDSDQKFLDNMTVGELEVTIGWRIAKSWNEILDLPEPKVEKEFRVMSHDYGQVTSVSA